VAYVQGTHVIRKILAPKTVAAVDDEDYEEDGDSGADGTRNGRRTTVRKRTKRRTRSMTSEHSFVE